MAAELDVLAAFRQREAARLALLPSFTLSLDAGRLSDGILSLLRLNPWILHSTVGMSVPIYTGGALTAEIRIANAKQEGAIAAYGAAVLTAFREVENALMNETVLAERLRYDARRWRIARTQCALPPSNSKRAGSLCSRFCNFRARRLSARPK